MLFDEMIGKDDFEYFMSKNCEISDLLEEFEALPDTEREKHLPFLRTAVEIRLRDELHDVSLEALTKLQAIKGIQFEGMFMSLPDEYVNISQLFGVKFYPANKSTKDIPTEPLTEEDIIRDKDDPNIIFIPADYEAVLFLLPVFENPKYSTDFAAYISRYALPINANIGAEYADFIKTVFLTYVYNIYRKKTALSDAPNIIDYAKIKENEQYISKETDTLSDVLRKLLSSEFLAEKDVITVINHDKTTYWLYKGKEEFAEIEDFINPAADVEALRELIGKHTIKAQGDTVIEPNELREELSKLTLREQGVANSLIEQITAEARLAERKKSKQSLGAIITNAFEKAANMKEVKKKRGNNAI
jgi:hypothetical protein